MHSLANIKSHIRFMRGKFEV